MEDKSNMPNGGSLAFNGNKKPIQDIFTNHITIVY